MTLHVYGSIDERSLWEVKKKRKVEQVTSCLWVSELCDSESNSSSAGQLSTCDFGITALLN